MHTLRVATYNPWELYKHEDNARYEQVERFITQVRPDILLVQELAGRAAGYTPERSIQRLARATGMVCAAGSKLPVCQAHHELALGILWRPGLTAIPGSLQVYNCQDNVWWHGLVVLEFVVNGVKVRGAVYHGPPAIGRPAREVIKERNREAKQIATILGSRPGSVMMGGDMNSLSASVDPNGDWYDPEPQPSGTQQDESMRSARSREADGILLRCGLTDVAPYLRRPRMPTTTARADSKYIGGRRLDRLYVTPDLKGRVRAYRVINTPTTKQLSDHLLVYMEIVVA